MKRYCTRAIHFKWCVGLCLQMILIVINPLVSLCQPGKTSSLPLRVYLAWMPGWHTQTPQPHPATATRPSEMTSGSTVVTEQMLMWYVWPVIHVTPPILRLRHNAVAVTVVVVEASFFVLICKQWLWLWIIPYMTDCWAEGYSKVVRLLLCDATEVRNHCSATWPKCLLWPLWSFHTALMALV